MWSGPVPAHSRPRCCQDGCEYDRDRSLGTAGKTNPVRQGRPQHSDTSLGESCVS